MERFNLRSFLLLLLAACFIASAFIPDFWIMVNYNLVFFVAFFCFGILNRRPLLIFLGLAFLSPYIHDLLDLDFAQWNLFSGIFLIGLALELLYGRSQKKGLTKDTIRSIRTTKKDHIFLLRHIWLRIGIGSILKKSKRLI